METIVFSYLIKVSISLILLFGIYSLLFRNDTFFKVRRFYLLAIIVFSVSMPLLTLDFLRNTTKSDLIYNLERSSTTRTVETNVLPEILVSIPEQITYNLNYIMLFMVVGTGVLFLKFAIQIIALIRLRIGNRRTDLFGVKIIRISGDLSPFSFFGWIFINPAIYDEAACRKMVRHEAVHSRQMHSFDVVLSEFLSILFWWNPVVWLLKREIKLNLEYLADQGVINRGYDSKEYQYLLLAVSKYSANMQCVNNFNVSQLKKRIVMINSAQSSVLSLFKYILILPLIALLLIGNTVYVFSKEVVTQTAGIIKEAIAPQSEIVNTIEETAGFVANSDNGQELIRVQTVNEPERPFVSVEDPPRFIGGDGELMKYLNMNIKYPFEAVQNGVQGLVVVRFVVSKTGTINQVEVIKSLDPDCDREAVRVVSAMPAWKPGKQNDKDVPVYFTLPVRFKLA